MVEAVLLEMSRSPGVLQGLLGMDHRRAVHGLWSEFVCSFKSMSFIKEKEQENAEGIAEEVSIVRPCWSLGPITSVMSGYLPYPHSHQRGGGGLHTKRCH